MRPFLLTHSKRLENTITVEVLTSRFKVFTENKKTTQCFVCSTFSVLFFLKQANLIVFWFFQKGINVTNVDKH